MNTLLLCRPAEEDDSLSVPTIYMMPSGIPNRLTLPTRFLLCFAIPTEGTDHKMLGIKLLSPVRGILEKCLVRLLSGMLQHFILGCHGESCPEHHLRFENACDLRIRNVTRGRRKLADIV